jgi:hypothetical protein
VLGLSTKELHRGKESEEGKKETEEEVISGSGVNGRRNFECDV